jgi:hypothetical protein
MRASHLLNDKENIKWKMMIQIYFKIEDSNQHFNEKIFKFCFVFESIYNIIIRNIKICSICHI